MTDFDVESEHRKKRRRREVVPQPAHSRLVFDDSLSGDEVRLSRSLIAALGTEDVEHYDGCVAIAPINPLHTELLDLKWTFATVAETETGHPHDQPSQVKLSSHSNIARAFLRTFAAQDHGRHGSHLPRSFEVQVVPVTAIDLDTIIVTVEKGLIEKVDEIQTRFGGGFQPARNRRSNNQENVLPQAGRNSIATAEERITELIRSGLSKLDLVHVGDIFPLPLPAHPITHVRPAPAIITESEPVSQGRVSIATKIIVVHAGGQQEKALRKLATPTAIIEESLEDTPEDETATDQFFSAAEDRNITTASELDGTEDDDSQTEASEAEDSEEESDSMDDMISLSAPGLPPQQAGTLSAMTAATPRPGQFSRMTGTHTPGSVYSSFTQTTARAGTRPGKVFRTEALLKKVPAELLHPKPAAQEDDESFVFVDTSILAKLGCFSGDWARIEVAKNVSSFALNSSSLMIANNDEDFDFRTVRLFGLPGLVQQKTRYTVDKTGDRRSSFTQSHSMMPLSPTVYLSPILLANLSNANFVKIGAMPKAMKGGRNTHATRPPSYRSPPLAREASLAKILTPLTQDPASQAILFSSLKAHFETRRRLIKVGDVLAIPVDEDLARVSATVGTSDNNTQDDQVLSRLNVSSTSDRARLRVAWFVVQSLDTDSNTDSSSTTGDLENWGGTAVLDTAQTKLGVSGTSYQKVSESISFWAMYWLGLKPTIRSVSVPQQYLITTSAIPARTVLPLEKRLSDLIAAATSPRAVNLGLPPLVILLHSAQRQVGKAHTAINACNTVGVHTFSISGHDLLSENASTTGGGDVKTEGLLRVRAERALSCGAEQTALLLQDVDVLTADRIIPTLRDIIKTTRVVVATTSKIDDISPGLRSLFTHELEVAAPDEVARETILRNICTTVDTPLSPSVNLKSTALQTAALVAGDLVDVVQRASLARSTRLAQLADTKGCTVSDIAYAAGEATDHLLPSDFAVAIAAARSTFSDAIGAPKIPSVTWKDVGGLASQKDAIIETISLPLTHPELFANGVRKRSGILFYGPPGTGKTLLAKAIATEFSLNFFSVKGPELLNMYIGESEANVRRVFQKARDARPCVVFFDELDSVAPKRGNQGDSGGVMDRIVSQLLAELDGMSGSGQSEDGQTNAGGVFVIGATNRPDLLDPALLRPGRFDKMLYLGVADSHESQVTILEALTRKFALDRDVNLRRVAERLPFTYTGADLYALCSDAMLKAITRKTKAVDDRVSELSRQRGESVSTGWFFDHVATPEDIEVVVSEEDFDLAQQELVGSVSAKELEHFERIRRLFEDQDISVGTSAGNKHMNGEATNRPQTSTTDGRSFSGEHQNLQIRAQSTRQKSNKGKGAAAPDNSAESENDYGFPSRTAYHGNGSTTTNGIKHGDFTSEIGNDEDLYD